MTQAGQPLTAAFKETHVEVDGFDIRYWESDPPQPLGAIVMLEGMTWGLSKLREALGQAYRVIALELPGFGESPANDRSQSVQELAHTMAQAAAAVAPSTYTLIGCIIRGQRGPLANATVARPGGGSGVDFTHYDSTRG